LIATGLSDKEIGGGGLNDHSNQQFDGQIRMAASWST
jgi:hypothetical protein